MFEWLTALFQAWNSANKVVEKALPDATVNNGKFELAKERLSVNERMRVLRHSQAYLRLHLRQSVDSFVEVAFDGLNADDKEDLRTALYELFPKRKHTK